MARKKRKFKLEFGREFAGITQTGGALRPASNVLNDLLFTRIHYGAKAVTQTGEELRPWCRQRM